MSSRTGIPYFAPYLIEDTPLSVLDLPSGKHRVAVIRQEGSNGDREMQAALLAAGLEPWVNMRDLLGGAPIHLNSL